MINEIERKFFINEMPDLTGIQPLRYERYFLKSKNGEEERISRINDRYFYEKKSVVSDLERTREKKEISAEEFNILKQQVERPIIRDRFDISGSPKISIQVYHGKHEGLIRAEVEFNSEEEAASFQPLPWMGAEMTGLPIARDAQLVNLSEEDFEGFLRMK